MWMVHWRPSSPVKSVIVVLCRHCCSWSLQSFFFFFGLYNSRLQSRARLESCACWSWSGRYVQPCCRTAVQNGNVQSACQVIPLPHPQNRTCRVQGIEKDRLWATVRRRQIKSTHVYWAIFSWVTAGDEKGGEATQVGHWWMNATPRHRLWFVIVEIARCHTSRHLRSHYHATSGGVTQTEQTGRVRYIPLGCQPDPSDHDLLSLRCLILFVCVFLQTCTVTYGAYNG